MKRFYLVDDDFLDEVDDLDDKFGEIDDYGHPRMRKGADHMANAKTNRRPATGTTCWDLLRTNRQTGSIEVYPKKFASRTVAEAAKLVLNGQKAK